MLLCQVQTRAYLISVNTKEAKSSLLCFLAWFDPHSFVPSTCILSFSRHQVIGHIRSPQPLSPSQVLKPRSLLHVVLSPSCVPFLANSHSLMFSPLCPLLHLHLLFTDDYLKFLHILSSIFIHILGPESLLLSSISLSSIVIVFKHGSQKVHAPPSGRQQNKLSVPLEGKIDILGAGREDRHNVCYYLTW